MKKLLEFFSVFKKRGVFLVVFFGFGIFSVLGQNKTISGTIVDKDGYPLPGASVIEKGTKKGAESDFDGKFSITVSNESAILVISYLGFSSKEVNVGKQTNLTITLEEDSATLDEIVVVGYGSQKKSDISGSVSQIDKKEIAKNPTANLSNALVGQTTGIIATQRSGEPGGDGSNILIRGIGTVGNSSPIYVIDGIVRSSRDFSQLNSNEIESFSVLKDASSAAVFGVRGGNGVILVTTKRGKAGKMQINFSTNLGVQERTRDPEFLGSYDYAMLYNEALENQGDAPRYSADDLQKYKDGSSPDTHPDTDWLSVLARTALMQTHSISANGGSDKIQYATSFGILEQDGLLDSDGFKRHNFRSNIDASVTNTTKLSFDVSGRNEKKDSPIEGEVFRWLTSARPNWVPIKYSNGGYSEGPAYLALSDNGYRKQETQVFKGRIQLEQQLPIDGLSIKGIVSYDKTLTDRKDWRFTKTPFYTLQEDSDGSITFNKSAIGANAASSLYQSHNDFQSITFETHLNYKKTIGDSNISGLLLYTETQEKWKFLDAKREDFKLAIDEMGRGNPTTRVNNGYSGSSGRQGVVGRVNWTYKDKYMLEGSFRADASEQFAPGNRWGFFPSGSLGYVISKESFLENSSVINFLKLRGSYGVLGNDRLGGARFLYLQTYYQGGSAVFGDADVQQTLLEGRLPNLGVTWETVKKLNIGFDARLWNGALSVTFDYFSDKRSDILGQRNLSVPSLLGVSLPVENLAKVDNSGIEVDLGHSNRINDDMSYSMNANLTYARNKIVFIDEAASDNPNIRRTGHPIGTQFGLKALGLFQTQEEIDNAATQTSNVPIAPGDVRYADLSGPDGVPDGIINDYDRTAIGPSNTPEIIFGYRGNLNYKDFEFSFLLQGATNVNQYYSGEAAVPFFLGSSGAYKQNLDRWTPDNPNASEPRVLIDAGNNQRGSSFWLKDASYLRLKNVELAYNVPVEKFEKKYVKGIRIYANANNVFTWTKIDNYDPENSQGRGWGYPQLRIWNFGINVNF